MIQQIYQRLTTQSSSILNPHGESISSRNIQKTLSARTELPKRESDKEAAIPTRKKPSRNTRLSLHETRDPLNESKLVTAENQAHKRNTSQQQFHTRKERQSLPSLRTAIRDKPGSAIELSPNENRSEEYFNNQQKVLDAYKQHSDLQLQFDRETKEKVKRINIGVEKVYELGSFIRM